MQGLFKKATDWLNNYLLLAMIAVFFLVTLNFYIMRWLMPHYIPYDVQRVFQLGLLVVASLCLIFSQGLQERWLKVFLQIPLWVRVALLLVALLGVISAIRAPLTNMALLEVAFYFLLFTFILSLAAAIKQQPIQYQASLIRIYYLGAITFLAIFISVIIHTLRQAGGDLAISMPGFINIRYFSEYQIWGLLLMIVPFMVKGRSKVLLVFLGCIFGLWWMMVFLDYSKGMLLSLVLAAVVVVVLYGKLGLSWIKWQSCFAVLGLLFYGLIFHGIKLVTWLHPQAQSGSALHLSYVSQSVYQSVTPRVALWQQAWHLFMTHPWLGVGPMHYAYYPNQYAAHAHNGYLQLLAEWGGLAFVLLMAVLFIAMTCWVKTFNAKTIACKSAYEQTLIMSLTAALTAGLSYIFVGGALITPLSQVMFCIIIGWALAVYQLTQTAPVLMGQLNYQRMSLIVLLIIATMFVAAMVGGVIMVLPELEMQWLMNTHFQGILMPGFWAQGRLC